MSACTEAGPGVRRVHVQQFASSDGHKLARSVLRPLLSFDPHDHQLEGICKSLDGVDLLAVLKTSGGKTGYFSMYILMLLALGKTPAICTPSRNIHQDPALIIICPTIGLEEDMVACVLLHEMNHSHARTGRQIQRIIHQDFNH